MLKVGLYIDTDGLQKNIGEYLFDPNSELSDLVSSKHRVLVWGEQGIGDQIIFASMLNDFKRFFQI